VTVKELIAALKKFPPDAQVAVRSHDNLNTEIQALVHGAERFDEAESTMPEITKGVGVVLW